jgi:hypothetical protein
MVDNAGLGAKHECGHREEQHEEQRCPPRVRLSPGSDVQQRRIGSEPHFGSEGEGKGKPDAENGES